MVMVFGVKGENREGFLILLHRPLSFHTSEICSLKYILELYQKARYTSIYQEIS